MKSKTGEFLIKARHTVKEILFGTKAVEEELASYEKAARAGEVLEGFIAHGGWDVIEEKILAPMEKNAFKVFQGVNPKEIEDVISAQMQAAIIDEIRSKVISTVEEGRMSREYISTIQTDSTLKEDE